MSSESTTATTKHSVESRVKLPQALLIGLIVGIGGSLLLFRGLLSCEIASTLWADNYDSRLLHWIAEWGYQVIVERRDALNFWNAPSFYPHTLSLAYSDSLLSAQIFYAPLRLLGFSAAGALYTTLACVSILGCLLSAAALKRIGGFTSLEIAVIVFAMHFGLSITGYLAHYQLFGFQLAFPFFLFLYLFITSWRSEDLVTLSLCFAFGVCFATYLAPMLLVVGGLAALPLLWQSQQKKEVLPALRRIGLPSYIVCGCVAVFIVGVQLTPYLKVSANSKTPSLDESALYSARVNSFLAPAFGGYSYWYQPRGAPTRFGDTERSFFPGFLISYSMVCFLLLWAAHRFRWYGAGELLAPGISSRFLMYALGIFAASAILAFGPYPAYHPALKFPFYFLTWIVPGLEHVRAPGRFGIFVGLPAIVFSLSLLRTLCKKQPHLWLISIFALVLVAESWPRFEVFPFRPDADGVYSQLRSWLPPGQAVLELPTAGGDSLRTLLRTTDQLQGTLIHGGKVVVGYGASTTPEAEAFSNLDLRIQRRKSRPLEALQFAEKLGINYFIIRLNRYVPQVRAKWVRLAQENQHLETLYADPTVLILRRR